MQIGSIDLPDEFLTALEEGHLVIFAGAGVSKPSGLMDFPELVEAIVGRKLLENERGQLDRVLGRANDRGVPVHRLAVDFLNKPDSQFNALHEDLVGLFGSGPMRIVTTNFDRHFEGASNAREAAAEVDRYAAPALPVGSKFEGLVHLHGVLGRSPEDLVLTDADFGRAYLTEGWAGRFVVELFRAYTIVFIGYSYGDTVMSYLTRGLAPTAGKGRFALAPAGEREKWELLGIQVIEYEAPSGGHRALREALRTWVNYHNRGFLGWSQRVKSLAEKEPRALDPGGAGELEYCLRNPKRRHIFYQHATDPAWLDWAETKGLLAPLFSFEGDQEPLHRLALWFTEDSLGPRGKAALRIASKTERPVCNALAAVAAQQVLWNLKNGLGDETRVRRVASWASLLIERTAPNGLPTLLGSWLEHLSPQDHPQLVVQILGHLMRCRPRFDAGRSRLLPGESSLTFEVVACPFDDLGDHWLELRGYKGVLAWPLVPVLTEALERRWRWQVALEGTTPADDPWGWDRHQVELPSTEIARPSGHFRSRSAGKFVDIGKDILDELLLSAPAFGALVIEQWLAASAPQLVQLGLYGLAKSSAWRPAKKLERLLTSHLPARGPFGHEVFEVLRKAYPLASFRQRERFLKRAGRLYRASTVERLIKEGASADRMRELIEKYMELGGSGGEKLAEILMARSGENDDSDE